MLGKPCKDDAEIGGIQPQPRNMWGPPEAGEKREEGSPLEILEGTWLC